MGQAQESTHKSHSAPIPSVCYDVDPHLIDSQTILPSSFSFAIQKMIAQVQLFSSQIQEHPIQLYLIQALDQRFSSSVLSAEAFHAGMDQAEYLKQGEAEQWCELANKQAFLRLIQNMQRNYHIEKSIKQEYERQLITLDKRAVYTKGSAFESLRKNNLAELSTDSQLDLGLIMRLVFYYYLRMFKINANQSTRQIVVDFHTKTGRMLSLLVFHGYLQLEQLFELLYHLVCVDKGSQLVLKKKLNHFHMRFHGLCLKHAHSIGVDKNRFQAIQTTTRVYLDQLYLKSLEQAQDPQIKNSDDVLMPIKVFPISRVKDKQRI